MKELIKELEKYDGMFMSVPDTTDITIFPVHDILTALKAAQTLRADISVTAANMGLVTFIKSCQEIIDACARFDASVT